ncbi:ABC transporter substrate-binding protein [Helcobacillus sp. ACRRO]|uniref:ABC transporter substrate-binding protein n=1 Tax=Helcobacillus sp. ACRRO TaxID=2918202 RepID=UPI001EF71DC7|nr:ABC transporter substrate-binding protein [Helcobacillus sp. ACRRO]MCG7427023.1 ABC transporter substrate-binding protein [Helcobacillus sp. ACRRO]
MNVSRRSLLTASAAATAAFAATALSACTTSASSPGAGGSDSSSDDAAPVTIKHIYGTTEIPSTPTRVATVSWVNADTALALGVVPVAMPAMEWGGNGNRSTDWIDAKLAELGGPAPTLFSEADGINADAIAAATPDVILAAYSGLTKDEYEKLSKIARVVGPIKANYLTSWQEAATVIGAALRKDPKELISSVEKQITDAGKDIPKGTTFIASTLDTAANTISLYTGDDTRPRLLRALGMTEAEVVRKNAPKDQFFFEWSPERADELDSDVIYSWIPAGTKPADVKANSLFGRIPAVQNDKLIVTDSDHATLSVSAASALSLPWAVKNVIPAWIETITA